MKLKAVIDSLDDVDEKYRDLYVAYDDAGTERFKLDVEGVPSHPDALALKNAHERSKQRIRALTTEVDDLKERTADLPEDFDPDLYERAKTQGVGGGKLPNEDEVRREASEAATRRAEEKHKRELEKRDEKIGRLETRVQRDVRNSALDAALDDAKVTDPAYRKAARALLASSVKVVEHDGDFEALAVDPELGDIPVAEHVKAWAGTDEGKAFIGPRESAGGGANGQRPAGTQPTTDTNPWKRDTFNVTQQAALLRENPTLAGRLKREAGFN